MLLRRREADVVLGWSRDGCVSNSTKSANLLTGHLRLIYDSFTTRLAVIIEPFSNRSREMVGYLGGIETVFLSI